MLHDCSSLTLTDNFELIIINWNQHISSSFIEDKKQSSLNMAEGTKARHNAVCKG
jgi:hypothetical protein